MARFLTPIDRARRLASKQRGMVTREQLRQCGLSDDRIDGLVGAGWFSPEARGVYLAAGASRSWRQAATAAVLAGPPGTRASHMTSGGLHGLCAAPLLPHVTVPRGRSARIRIALVHRGTIGVTDGARVDGIDCTSVARTLVDCAALLDRPTLADMVDVALCGGLTTVDRITDSMARASAHPGRAGYPMLRAVLAAWDGPIRADSPAEMRLFRLLGEWGYPTPERQVEISDASGRVIAHGDVGWPARRIALDYDGLIPHAPTKWERDELRHVLVEQTGWVLLHVDKADLLPGERRLYEALARTWNRAA